MVVDVFEVYTASSGEFLAMFTTKSAAAKYCEIINMEAVIAPVSYGTDEYEDVEDLW